MFREISVFRRVRETKVRDCGGGKIHPPPKEIVFSICCVPRNFSSPVAKHLLGQAGLCSKTNGKWARVMSKSRSEEILGFSKDGTAS